MEQNKNEKGEKQMKKPESTEIVRERERES